MSDGDVLFFGCVDRAGHHLYSGPSLAWARSHPIPWSLFELDPPVHGERGQRAPALDAWMATDAQEQGQAVLSFKSGWTRLGWADRSVDHRRGSHANIIAKGLFTGDEMLALARATWPALMARMTYPLVVCRTANHPVA